MNLSPRFALDTLFVIGGAFLAVVALPFTAVVAGWTGFGVFTGLAVIALTDLAAHEVTTENVVHQLVVTQSPAEAPVNGSRAAA